MNSAISIKQIDHEGVNSLSNEEAGMGKFPAMLLYYRVGCGFLAILSIAYGLKYTLFSIVQFGIVQLFIMILISFFLRIWRYERLAGLAKDNPEIFRNNGDEQAQQEEKEKKVDPEEEFRTYRDKYYPRLLLAVAITGIIIELIVFNNLKGAANLDKPPILIGIFSIIVSFLLLISSNLFEHESEHTEEYVMLGHFFRAGQWQSFSSGLAVVIKYLGYGQVEHWLSYLTVLFVVIVFMEVGLQCIIRLVDGREGRSIALRLHILPALLSGGSPVNKLLVSLEENAGISLRSTWTVGFIRRNIPLITLIISVFFWLMTAFVQVNPDEKGILYSLGKIKSREAMLPGIHLKWPWPVETVKIYPACKVQNFTVGYESDKQNNYLWTMSHGGEEYKLLLGDGKELVSINMRVYYKIGDLYEYVLQYDNPEEKLKAEAYRILLNETVITNLDNLLSRDRSSFSQMITQKLQETSKQQKLGLDVTDVALTSIHPPVEIAREYQEIVSANIQKQVIITKAKSYADSSIPKAEQTRGEMVKTAQAEALSRNGQALSEANEYTYQQKAYRMNTGAYKEWKWLEVLENALQGKKVYLLDKNLSIHKGGIWLDMRQMRVGENNKEAEDIMKEEIDFIEGEGANVEGEN